MARLRPFKPEQIVEKLREADVLIGQGFSTPGGRLKRLLADAELDKAILREAARPND